MTRRRYLQTTALASAALSFGSIRGFGRNTVSKPMKRQVGRIGFEATTLGLGGQASLQWTPSDVDTTRIILKAFALGINYFDTSNMYGPSQTNYGRAFRELHLIPGEPGYNEKLRRSMFLTTKTGLRWAKGGWQKPGLGSFTNGPRDSKTVDDIHRSLSQMFGDGQGNYPAGAYLDMVLMHSLTSMAEVDALYEGYGKADPKAENIGAIAALVDLRDGSNLTGLNPKGEKLIRHIGFSGHHSPAVNMEMMQRDERNVLDAMLVAINANDRLQFNMQYNAIPLAVARNMGLIAMKTFADGAMYAKPSRWSMRPDDVVRTVGSASLASRPLVQYSLTTPGIHTLIIGTGHVDDDAAACQLQQNLAAAQVKANGLTVTDRRAIEKQTAPVKDGKTNYFQAAVQALTAPREVGAETLTRDGKRVVRVTWQTAYAGDEPIERYEVRRGGTKIGVVAHKPQASKAPFAFEDLHADGASYAYSVVSVDAVGRTAASADLRVVTG